VGSAGPVTGPFVTHRFLEASSCGGRRGVVGAKPEASTASAVAARGHGGSTLCSAGPGFAGTPPGWPRVRELAEAKVTVNQLVFGRDISRPLEARAGTRVSRIHRSPRGEGSWILRRDARYLQPDGKTGIVKPPEHAERGCVHSRPAHWVAGARPSVCARPMRGVPGSKPRIGFSTLKAHRTTRVRQVWPSSGRTEGWVAAGGLSPGGSPRLSPPCCCPTLREYLPGIRLREPYYPL
jgi:hypothetical protein